MKSRFAAMDRSAVTRLLAEPSFSASAAWVQVEIASMSPAEAVIGSLTAVGAGVR
jgi:hypothetical protein